MQQQLQHKRFTMTTVNNKSFFSERYWYAQPTMHLLPIGQENKGDHQRPEYIWQYACV